MTERLRVGTRGSPLALAQTEEALRRLREAHPDLVFETVEIQTHGDEGYGQDLGTTLDGKQAFTKRIDEALRDGKIDFAVHSLKDVPTDPVPGVRVAAVPVRADPRDVLVAKGGVTLAGLRPEMRIGTSSLRRKAQLLAEWPLLRIVDLHGNVGTRLRRLDSEEFDGVVLAAAGIERLGLGGRRPWPIDPDRVTPAPGQGALAIEARTSDARIGSLLKPVDDPRARQETDAERALSARLGGGCNVPFGALATQVEGRLRLRAVVASSDGRKIVRATVEAPVSESARTVDAVAARLLEGGADEILKEVS